MKAKNLKKAGEHLKRLAQIKDWLYDLEEEVPDFHQWHFSNGHIDFNIILNEVEVSLLKQLVQKRLLEDLASIKKKIEKL